MAKRIFRVSLITSGGILTASFFTALIFLYSYFGTLQDAQLRVGLDLAVRGMETGGPAYLEGLSPGDIRLTWVGGDGGVLWDTQAPAETLDNHGKREEIRQALESGTGYSARFSETLTAKTINCAARLSDGTVLRISARRLTPLALTAKLFQPLCVLVLAALILSAVLSVLASGQEDHTT